MKHSFSRGKLKKEEEFCMKKLLIMGLLVGTLAFVSACGPEAVEPLDLGTDEPGQEEQLEGDEQPVVEGEEQEVEGEEDGDVQDLDTDLEDLLDPETEVEVDEHDDEEEEEEE